MELSKEVLNYWATKEVIEYGYDITLAVRQEKEDRKIYDLKILFDDGDLYAGFEIIEFYPDKELFETKNSYLVKLDDEYINDEMEFTDTLDECINGCIYYFHTRF